MFYIMNNVIYFDIIITQYNSYYPLSELFQLIKIVTIEIMIIAQPENLINLILLKII